MAIEIEALKGKVVSLKSDNEEISDELQHVKAANKFLLWQIGQFSEVCERCGACQRECMKRNILAIETVVANM